MIPRSLRTFRPRRFLPKPYNKLSVLRKCWNIFSKTMGLVSGNTFDDLTKCLQKIRWQFDPDLIKTFPGTQKIQIFKKSWIDIRLLRFWSSAAEAAACKYDLRLDWPVAKFLVDFKGRVPSGKPKPSSHHAENKRYGNVYVYTYISLSLSLYIYKYIYIYIYDIHIHIYRERERDIDIYIYIYIYAFFFREKSRSWDLYALCVCVLRCRRRFFFRKEWLSWRGTDKRLIIINWEISENIENPGKYANNCKKTYIK